jgi:hypothetical protein
MVMELDEPIRRLIDGFATGTITLPTHLGAGNVYFVPSESELGAYHVVAFVGYTDAGRKKSAWICGCHAFRFGQQGDFCKHIRIVQNGLDTYVKVSKKKKS